jgi:5'-methylthioadenosine nucleosidase
VAYVADLLRVPLILLKAVTDIVDGNRATIEEFLENLSTAANALQNVIPKVFDLLSTRLLSNL